MPKTKISEYSATANSNTDVASINIDEGCAPSGINNAIRAVMGHLKDFQAGTKSDSFNGPTNGAHNGTVGATTPANGAFTTVSATGNVTLGDGSYLLWGAGDGSSNIRGNSTANYIAFNNVGAEAMLINSSNNVGIGTSSPTTKLEVNVAGVNGINLATSGSVDSPRLFFTGSGGSGTSCVINNANGSLRFGRNATVGSSSGDESMRIDSSGNLLVGTTSSGGGGGVTIRPNAVAPYIYTAGSATTNSDVGLYVYSTGAAAYRFYVGYGGTIYATATTITGISDQRLKENIRDLDDGLDKVMALQPRKFDWKEGKGQDIKNARGFIAQEFETVFPDMIEEWQDAPPEGEEPYKAVNANLIPTLVKAIQEQQALITTLTERITALEQA